MKKTIWTKMRSLGLTRKMSKGAKCGTLTVPSRPSEQLGLTAPHPHITIIK